MKYSLRYYPDPILLTKCEEVTEFNSELHELLDAMQKILLSTKGIGISSNQCGALKRAFILKDKKGKIWEFINPILKDSNGIANIYEGCLSSPNVYEKVLTRANEVTVVAKDRNGVEFTIVAEGIEAVCVFHEYDHLDGIFWFDKLPSRQVKRSVEKQWQKQKKKLNLV